MANYALVRGGVVTNLIVADAGFIQDTRSTYDIAIDCVSHSEKVDIGYAYDSVLDLFSPTATLAQVKAAHLDQFNRALKAYTSTFFSLEDKLQLFILYCEAQKQGKTNRVAYIQPLFDWAKSLIEYAQTYVVSVTAMTDVQSVVNTTWSFEDNSPAPPQVTSLAAIIIPD